MQSPAKSMCVKGWGKNMAKKRTSASEITDLQSFMHWVALQRECLNLINSHLAPSSEVAYELFFRGVSHTSYKNIPSIFRDDLIYNEDTIFNEAVSKNYTDFANDKTTFDMLVRMQHYGVPTRLLDVTQDPLVALYFATRLSAKDTPRSKRGKVYAYFVSKDKVLYPDSPEVCLYSNLAKQKIQDWIPQDKNNCVSRLVQSADRETPINKTIDVFDLQHIYCVKPRLNNPRIIRQKGAFLLFGNIGRKYIYPQIQDFENIYKWEFVKNKIRTISYAAIEDINNNDDVIKLESEIKSINEILFNNWLKLKKRLESPSLLGGYFHYDEFQKELLIELRTNASEKLKEDFLFCDRSLKNKRYQNIIASILQTNTAMTALYDIFSENGTVSETSKEVSNKAKIAEELENYGVNEESLFPELDVLGKSLRRKYEHKED